MKRKFLIVVGSKMDDKKFHTVIENDSGLVEAIEEAYHHLMIHNMNSKPSTRIQCPLIIYAVMDYEVLDKVTPKDGFDWNPIYGQRLDILGSEVT